MFWVVVVVIVTVDVLLMLVDAVVVIDREVGVVTGRGVVEGVFVVVVD